MDAMKTNAVILMGTLAAVFRYPFQTLLHVIGHVAFSVAADIANIRPGKLFCDEKYQPSVF